MNAPLLRRRLLASTMALGVAMPVLAADVGGPIKILVTGPFTGGSASVGVSIRDGARLAVSEINAAGGVLGRQLQLIERNDEGRNELGVQIARDAVNDRVQAVVGLGNTGVALASSRYFQDAKIPLVVTADTGAALTRQFADQPENFVFRVAAHDGLQAPMIVEEVTTQRGLRRVALLADNTSYGQSGRVDLEMALSLKGIQPASSDSFKVGDTAMVEQLEKARAAGAEAVIGYGAAPELAAIANTLAKMGWKVPLFGPWTLGSSAFLEQARQQAEGLQMPQTFVPSSTVPKRKAFVEAFTRTIKPEGGTIAAPSAAAQTYDSVYLLAAAMKQARGVEGSKVRAAMESLAAPVEGVLTTYTRPWTHQDHEAVTSSMVVFAQWKGGKLDVVKEEDRSAVVRKNLNDKVDLYKR